MNLQYGGASFFNDLGKLVKLMFFTRVGLLIVALIILLFLVFSKEVAQSKYRIIYIIVFSVLAFIMFVISLRGGEGGGEGGEGGDDE